MRAGLKKITLKVYVPSHGPQHSSPRNLIHQYPARSLPDLPAQPSLPLLDIDGTPTQPIMNHLLDLFFLHMGCLFPSLEKRALRESIEREEASAFLLNCIAAAAAR